MHTTGPQQSVTPLIMVYIKTMSMQSYHVVLPSEGSLNTDDVLMMHLLPVQESMAPDLLQDKDFLPRLELKSINRGKNQVVTPPPHL